MGDLVKLSFDIVTRRSYSEVEIDVDTLRNAIREHAPEWTGWNLAEALDDLSSQWPDRFVAVMGAVMVLDKDPDDTVTEDVEHDATDLDLCAECGGDLDQHCDDCGECPCNCDVCDTCGYTEDECECEDESDE